MYSSKLNSNRNFEHLVCSIYQFVDLVCKALLHQPAKATHPHRYNTSVLFAQCFIVNCHYQSKRTCLITLQWWTILSFGVVQSQPLSEQCRCIVAMWVALVSWCSRVLRVRSTNRFSLLEYAVHKAKYIWSKFPHFSISSNIISQQNDTKMYPSHEVMFN